MICHTDLLRYLEHLTKVLSNRETFQKLAQPTFIHITIDFKLRVMFQHVIMVSNLGIIRRSDRFHVGFKHHSESWTSRQGQ